MHFFKLMLTLLFILQGADLKWSNLLNLTGLSVLKVLFGPYQQTVSVLFSQSYILTLSTNTGDLLRAYNLSSNLEMSFFYNEFMLLDKEGSAIIALARHPEGKPDYYYETVLLKAKSIQVETPEIVWSMNTTINYERAVSLTWDTVDSFVMASSAGSAYVTRINATNGQPIWRYELNYATKVLANSLYQSADQTDFAIACNYERFGRGIVYYRMRYAHNGAKPTAVIGLSTQYIIFDSICLTWKVRITQVQSQKLSKSQIQQITVCAVNSSFNLGRCPQLYIPFVNITL